MGTIIYKDTFPEFTTDHLQHLEDLIKWYRSCINYVDQTILQLRLKAEEIQGFRRKSLIYSTLSTLLDCIGGTLLIRFFLQKRSLKLPAIITTVGALIRMSTWITSYLKQKKFRKEVLVKVEKAKEMKTNTRFCDLFQLVNEFEELGMHPRNTFALAVRQMLEVYSSGKLKGGRNPSSAKNVLPEITAKIVSLCGSGGWLLTKMYSLANESKIPKQLLYSFYCVHSILTWRIRSLENPMKLKACSAYSKMKELKVANKVAKKLQVKLARTTAKSSERTIEFWRCFGVLYLMSIDGIILLREWIAKDKTEIYVKNKITKCLLPLYTQLTDVANQLNGLKQALKLKGEERKCICQPVEISIFYLNIESLDPLSNKEKIIRLRHHIETTKPDIIVWVETSFLDSTAKTDDLLKLKFGMEEYVIFRHDIKNNRDMKKRGEQLGGILVAYNLEALSLKRFQFAIDTNSSNDSTRFFILSRFFNCSGCKRTGTVETKLKTYSFVIHYRPPYQFRETGTLSSEDRADILANDNKPLDDLRNYFENNRQLTAAVIVGNFTWNEKEWTQRICGVNSINWSKMPMATRNHTTRDKTSPLVEVLALPKEFVHFPKHSVTEMQSMTQGLNFKLHFGKDFETFVPCPFSVCQ